MEFARGFVFSATVLAFIVCGPAVNAEENQPGSPPDRKLEPSNQFKQMDVINIDEVDITNDRVLMKGHVEIVLVPRDENNQPVTFKSDSAECTYTSQQDPVPEKIVAQGNVTVVQGDNRLTTDKATWFQAEGRILCEGNPVATYKQGRTRAETIEYYLADGRIVGYKVTGTWLLEKPESPGSDEQDGAQ